VRVTVQLFARLRDLAGRDRCVCDLPDGSTVADVWRLTMDDYPALRDFASAVSAAVNTDFAPLSTVVRDGDDVAFLPPVSGGSD